MKLQIWQTLLCCFAAAMFLTLGVLAADIVDSGTCGADGDNLTWTLDSDGVLIISGLGEMDNYDSADSNHASWYEERDNIITVIIGDGITTIGNYSFLSCYSLTNVTIPNSVTVIGIGAFLGCNTLMDATIPNSVNTIGAGAFQRCFNLESVTISSNITRIDDYAFYECHNSCQCDIYWCIRF